MPKKTKSSKNELLENSTTEDKENNNLNEDNTDQIEESLEFFGQKIRKTRIANNLSLESVSGHLHISVKILEAIEEGNPEKGPTPVFFRGLVRTYCQFLELDKTEFIDKIDKLLKIKGEEEKIKIKTLKPVFSISNSYTFRNTMTILLIIFVSSLVYFLYFSQVNIDYKTDNLTQVNDNNEAIVNETKTKIDTLQKIQTQSFAIEHKLEKPPKLEELKLDQKQQKNNNQIQQAKIIEPQEPLTLEIEASKGTWISISVDNSEIRDFRIGTDEIHLWEAKNNFLLTIGNTKVVRVLLNGREIETNRTHDLLSNWIVDSSYLP